MELDTIGTVLHTDDVQDVNAKLQEGWVLIAIATGTKPEGEPWIRYSLGEQYEDENEDEEEEDEGEEDDTE